MRSGFNSRQGIHDLVAYSHASAVRLGIHSRLLICDLSFVRQLSVSGSWVFRLAILDFIPNTIPALLRSKDVLHLSSVSWNVLGELMKIHRAWVWVPILFTLMAWLSIWS